jgi:hypothetical protein
MVGRKEREMGRDFGREGGRTKIQTVLLGSTLGFQNFACDSTLRLGNQIAEVGRLVFYRGMSRYRPLS